MSAGVRKSVRLSPGATIPRTCSIFARVKSHGEVMINAKAPGKTTIVIWETGSLPARYQVNVEPDTTEFEAFKQQLRDSLPDSSVQVSGSVR